MRTFIKAVKRLPVLDVLGPRLFANKITGFLKVYYLMDKVWHEIVFFYADKPIMSFCLRYNGTVVLTPIFVALMSFLLITMSIFSTLL